MIGHAVLLTVCLAAPASEPPTGRGFRIAAGITAGAGVILSGIGVGGLAHAENYKHDNPFQPYDPRTAPGFRLGVVSVTIGLAALVASIPLFVVGKRRRDAWEAWNETSLTRLRPSFGRTAHGTWTAGLTLRF